MAWCGRIVTDNTNESYRVYSIRSGLRKTPFYENFHLNRPGTPAASEWYLALRRKG